tara:strand:+ start:413 stop:814 length:402 start_codon:yes stop_codon:yes gene_type:complete
MINQVTLVGTVKQEPRSAANGALLNFSIVTWSHGKDGKRWETTHFIDVSAKRPGMPPLVAGQLVAITGTITRRSYEKNGEKVWVQGVLAFNVTNADGATDHRASNGNGASYGNSNVDSGGQYPPRNNDEEIPF